LLTQIVDTSKHAYEVTKVANVLEVPDQNVIMINHDNLINITGMTCYENYSPEELRYFDYHKGLKAKQTPETVRNPGGDCHICLEPIQKVNEHLINERRRF
jgi:hypothetical protein